MTLAFRTTALDLTLLFSRYTDISKSLTILNEQLLLIHKAKVDWPKSCKQYSPTLDNPKSIALEQAGFDVKIGKIRKRIGELEKTQDEFYSNLTAGIKIRYGNLVNTGDLRDWKDRISNWRL
ncbi:MAG: hypothetical protein JSS32_04490 [Verrucomicrobia bacterium]|nr:hypothetical protein [Verrucomicrobiota bacterium]